MNEIKSDFQIYWCDFKRLKDGKNRLLPRFVRREKLRICVKGLKNAKFFDMGTSFKRLCLYRNVYNR